MSGGDTAAVVAVSANHPADLSSWLDTTQQVANALDSKVDILILQFHVIFVCCTLNSHHSLFPSSVTCR